MFERNGSESVDVISDTLSSIARYILVVVIGLSPVFFIPVVYAPFAFSKTFFVLSGLLLALIFYSLCTLRRGVFSLHTSVGYYSSWLLALGVFLAALLSGDMHDSLIGDSFGVQSAAFVGLIALVISTVAMLGSHKSSVMKVYILLTGSSLIIGIFHIARLFFGPEFLSLGLFASSTASVIGSWNDLALFFALSVLLVLVAVEQFPLTVPGRVLLSGVGFVSLFILGVINFTAIWVVLGLVSLIILMFGLVKNRFTTDSLSFGTRDTSGTLTSILFSSVVFIVSISFIIGGSFLGGVISQATGISYVEVRPSLSATTDITRAVYAENILFGIGPNKFSDAWRLHKDQSINQTVFWNTPFEAGIGYIPTFAATSGVLGIVLWVFFLGSILWIGTRVVFSTAHMDKFWYFIGTSSFVSAVYLWGMSIIYVPGPVILILAATFTGILFVTYTNLSPQQASLFSVAQNKRYLFILVLYTMLIIVGSVSALYVVGRQYSGLISFNKAVSSVSADTTIDSLESDIVNSYTLAQNDRYAREIVGLQLSKMNLLVTLPEPTEEQRQQFENATANAINAGRLAVSLDQTDPQNWILLGNVYNLLTLAKVEGSYALAQEAYNTARTLDPLNPEIVLLLAQLESRNGNLTGAKEIARESIQLKQNYTDAFFFISQIDIAAGNIDAAIQSTLANITLDPQNSARYYQLGVLYLSAQNPTSAVQALERAVALNTNYANARFYLAIAYDTLDRPADAKAQLEVILELNPGNTEVNALLQKLQNGESLDISFGESRQQVPEVVPVRSEDGEVTTTTNPDSPLIAPINTIPSVSDEETEQPVADSVPSADQATTSTE